VLNFQLGRSVITTNDKVITDTFGESDFVFDDDESADYFIDAETIKLQGSDGEWYQIDISDPVYDGLNDDIYFTYEEYNISFGYILFDYRTFLIKNSYLAEICDVEKFIKTFSMEYLQGFFVPRHLKMRKYRPIAEDSWDDDGENDQTSHIRYVLPLQKEEGTTDAEYSPSEIYAIPEALFTSPEATSTKYPALITTNSGITIKQYVAQRNAEFASTDENNDYKMIAFEFQNIDREAVSEHWDERVYDKYEVGVDVTDNTKQALTGVIAQYLLAQAALNEYLLEAEAACSYNNIDGIFNDFFAESMIERHTSLPSASPWIYAAVTYIRHLDFLTNKYGGDEAQMLFAAKEVIQKISPQTGTLPLLQGFFSKMESLYDELYAPTSVIGVKMGGGDTTGDGIPDMWSVYATSRTAARFFDTLTEATFIEDDRNQFLAAHEARTSALGRLGVDLAKAERAQAAAAERSDAEDEIRSKMIQVQYEHGRIKYKSDKSGCNYVVKRLDPAHLGEYWWVNPHNVAEFDGVYQEGWNGPPTKYAARLRDNQKINGDWKCRSRAKTGNDTVDGWKNEIQYLNNYDSDDWNDNFGGDPKGTTLGQKLLDSSPVTK